MPEQSGIAQLRRNFGRLRCCYACLSERSLSAGNPPWGVSAFVDAANAMSRLILLNNPMACCARFTAEPGRACLKDYIHTPGVCMLRDASMRLTAGPAVADR